MTTKKMNIYKPVIGLEVHVELKTKSKMFCKCSADYFGKTPNTHVCPVCLGLPGALPYPNKTAINWCIMIGLALNCEIPLFSKFDRKNYFYPDLPKGYQISQYDQPFAINGSLKLKVQSEKSKAEEKKIIRIRRVHMEEDTAKLSHQLGISNIQYPISNKKGVTLIDFNRSGVPLVEIVTEPDFESPQEVKQYLQKLQQIVRYLDVSNADMEKGEMRLEPNISLSLCHPELGSGSQKMPKQVRHGTLELPPYKVEVKNINSFRFVEKAINFELERQKKILEEGKIPEQETRGWDEIKQKTVSQRTKEEAHDYRYFPEPDIPPFHWKESQISNIKFQMPEMPDEKFNRFKKEYELPEYDIEILTREKNTADFFEEAVRVGKDKNIIPKQVANHIINKKIDIIKILPAELIQEIITATQTIAIDEKELEKVIEEVLLENQKAAEDYKKGKEEALMFLIGQVMRKIGKKIDTNLVKDKIVKKIK